MIVSKGISFPKMVAWSWHHVTWLILVMSFAAWLYDIGFFAVHIPWVATSVIGTAVAFYVGFKNNQAYDRMWEARKIWGGIVNDSRTWGMMVDAYVSDQFSKVSISKDEIYLIKQRLIYNHIGWLYAHRSQLLVPTSWEHVSQGGPIGKTAKRYQKFFGVGLVDDEVSQTELKRFLPASEFDRLIHYKNTATQIINEQSRELAKLREQNLIDDFRHMEMTNVLKSFYTLQGKNERIKKFPLPRQYANISRYFVGIFIMLLPFSLIPEMQDISSWGVYFGGLITALVGYVYIMMEIVGDYSENPFQGMANDIPMLSLCRVIEIDLREMLEETDLPEPIQAKRNILM